MRRAAALALLALPGLVAQEAPVPVMQNLRIEGGGEDEARLVRSALGLKEGMAVDDAALLQGLAAVRRIGRFQSVEATREGGTLLVRVKLLLPLKVVEWAEGRPTPEQRKLLPSLPRGARFGDLRLEEWQTEARTRLRDGGWPEADPKVERLDEGARLRVQLHAGPPALVRSVVIEGDPGPYSRAKVLKTAGLVEGRSLWSPLLQRKAPQQLRERFLKDHRLEGRADCAWDTANGRVVLTMDAGPKVRIGLPGNLITRFFTDERSTEELLPQHRAAVFDARLLEDGARRLRRYYREQGYAQAQVSVERVILSGTAEHPEKVEYRHTITLGPRFGLGRVTFEGATDVSEPELQATVAVVRSNWPFSTRVRPELLRGIEERVRNFYRLRGYAEVRVHAEAGEGRDGRQDVKVVVKEGSRRLLRELILEVVPQPGLAPDRLAQALAYWLQDRPASKKGKDGLPAYPSDRIHLQGLTGWLDSLPASPEGAARFRMHASARVPFVRADLAAVVSDLRQQLVAAGSERPKVHFEDDGKGESLLIQVPAQPFDHFRRLVVRNLDRTRPEAVLREYPREPGDTFNPVELDRALGRASDLGVFSRLDLAPLADQPGQEESGWQRGDLELKTEERGPWTFTSGFAYDSAQGYRFLEGVQRNNLGGMGRTADLSVRAGDSTLRSQTLRNLFSTGKLNRSLDSYTLGYTDPWFLPGALDRLLSPRTQFHIEGSYLEEAQPAFFARRRRALAGLEWKITEGQTAQLGYRFERADLGANRNAQGEALISPDDLQEFARTPLSSVISAPRLKVSVDHRDKPNDPTQGSAFEGLLEFGLQAFGTSDNASFVRLDLHQQWNWPVGFQAAGGVVALSLRLGIARPTANSVQELPLTERYFGGGPFSVRGVEPGFLGPTAYLTKRDPQGQPISVNGDGLAPYQTQLTPLGGQVVTTANLEYRFPMTFISQSLWGELFVDGGQVYERVRAGDRIRKQRDPANPSVPAMDVDTGAPFPHWRVTPGFGLILKIGFPIKLEYATDWQRIFGKYHSAEERKAYQETQLSTLLISAGFQF